MRVGPYLAVFLALLCLVHNTAADPEPEPEALKKASVDTVPVGTRINPRFYVQVGRNDKRSMDSSLGAEEDELSPEEEAELAEEEEEDNSVDSEDTIETYYPVSDDNGQTYLIPERVLQSMVDKQVANDESDTFLVPNGSVDLDDEESEEDDETNSAIVLSEGETDENELVEGTQYIAIVQQPEVHGKSRRPMRRAGGVRRRRVGGRRRRRTRRGGSRKKLVRRRTRRKIRRGGGRRRGVRRRGIRRRGAGGGVRLGSIRLRPRNRNSFRF